MGIIGGELARHILKHVGKRAQTHDPLSGARYDAASKLETLLGNDVWRRIGGRVVLDYGCGQGHEAIEIARRGAKRVIGLDIQERMLAQARTNAASSGVADICEFTSATAEQVDLIVSLDAFEHFSDPAGVLADMQRRLKPRGRILIAFGPPWLHPLGGHLFSVFPWAHVLFTEEALLRWRSQFKDDGARRFADVAGGLNQMTVRRFQHLIDNSGFEVENLEVVPIRKLRWAATRVTREVTTSIVRAALRPRRRV